MSRKLFYITCARSSFAWARKTIITCARNVIICKTTMGARNIKKRFLGMSSPGFLRPGLLKRPHFLLDEFWSITCNMQYAIEIGSNCNFQVSQGGVKTYLRWGDEVWIWVQNVLRNLAVKEFWKSVYVCRSCDQKSSVRAHCFLDTLYCM